MDTLAVLLELLRILLLLSQIALMVIRLKKEKELLTSVKNNKQLPKNAENKSKRNP